jgi:general secretion pathway protein G
MKVKGGFTLIEVLVIVTIIGVLAAIAIPQYQSGTKDAKLACLSSNLHIIRKQIELYKIHHNGVLPAVVGDAGDDFTRRMTKKTDGSGAAGTQYGPYVERMPVNEFNQRDSVRVGGAAAGANADGWRFDPLTSEFRADDNQDGNGDGVPDHTGL